MMRIKEAMEKQAPERGTVSSEDLYFGLDIPEQTPDLHLHGTYQQDRVVRSALVGTYTEVFDDGTKSHGTALFTKDDAIPSGFNPDIYHTYGEFKMHVRE